MTDKSRILAENLQAAKREYDLVNNRYTALKKEFIEYLNKEAIDSYRTEAGGITYKASERSTFNDERLLAIIKDKIERGVDGYPAELVVTREVVDEDLLEDLVHQGKLNPADLAEAVDTKVVKTLRFVK